MYSDAYVRDNKRMKMMPPEVGYSMALPPHESGYKCVVCQIVFSSMNDLHWHQTYRHTSEELSLAVLGWNGLPKQPNPAEKAATFSRKQNAPNTTDYSPAKPMTSMTVPVDYGMSYEVNDKKTWMVMNKSPENFDNRSWSVVSGNSEGYDKRTWSTMTKNTDGTNKKTWLINSSPEIYDKKWGTNANCSKAYSNKVCQNNNFEVYDKTSWATVNSPELFNNKNWSLAVDDKKTWLTTSQSPEMYDRRSWLMMNKSPTVDDAKSWSSMSLSPETIEKKPRSITSKSPEIDDKKSWSIISKSPEINKIWAATCKSPEMDDKQSWSTVSKSPEIFDKESWSTVSKSPDEPSKYEDIQPVATGSDVNLLEEPKPSTSTSERMDECTTSQPDPSIELDPWLIELRTVPEIKMEDFFASVDNLCSELTELKANPPKSRLKSSHSWRGKSLKTTKDVQ